MKIHPVGAELFHVDRQTDRNDEANSHFCGFTNEPTKLLNILISNFVKIHPVGAELFHVDRQTDRNDEADSHFCGFTNAPTKRIS